MADYKRLFLDGYSYYLTIVTHKRMPLLIEHIEALRESFCESKRYYSYSIDAIVILPDHLHMIITPSDVHEYPKIIRAIKYNFSMMVRTNVEQSMARAKKGMTPVWQKRYYEHTIRDEKDYLRCLEYMKNNPIKHELVENGEVWKYSSFSE
jgi:putative transposase